MDNVLFSLILNSVLALLLIVTIFACGRLNTRIRILQDSKSDLARLISQFDETTERATASIVDLQAATKRIGENIQTKIDKANFLADDLSFMIEKGSKIADQMEGGFAGNRTKTPSPQDRGKPPIQVHASEPEQRQRAQAAKAAPAPQASAPAGPRVGTPDRGTGNQNKTNASLESVLERMAGRGGAQPTTKGDPQADGKRGAPSVRVRSKAEQELFDALKSGR